MIFFAPYPFFLYVHLITFLSTQPTPMNIAVRYRENVATEDGGKAFAKAKNSFSFFGGKLTKVCEPA
jgi:hypothetical protein